MAFLSARHERFLVSHSLLLLRSAAAARADHFVQHTAYLLRLNVRLNTEATLLSSYWPYCVVDESEKKGIHNYKKYLADLMHDFIRSPDAIAIGLSHVVLLGDHGNAGATNEIKQGGSIFRCIRCIMPSYLWPHIIRSCVNLPSFGDLAHLTSFCHTSMCTTQDIDEAMAEMVAYQSITMFHTKSSDGKTDLLTRPWQKQVVAKMNIEQSVFQHNLIYPMSLLFFQCCFGTLKRFSRLADLLALAKNALDIVTFARKCILVQIPEPEGQPSIPLGICSCGKCCNGASLREQWMQARQTSRAQSLNIQSMYPQIPCFFTHFWKS